MKILKKLPNNSDIHPVKENQTNAPVLTSFENLVKIYPLFLKKNSNMLKKEKEHMFRVSQMKNGNIIVPSLS